MNNFQTEDNVTGLLTLVLEWRITYLFLDKRHEAVALGFHGGRITDDLTVTGEVEKTWQLHNYHHQSESITGGSQSGQHSLHLIL